MSFHSHFKSDIFSITEATFNDKALELFDYQYHRCQVYRTYIDTLKINPKRVSTVEQIPFLPIEFFKTHKVLSSDAAVEAVFESSGTTGQIRSRHYINDVSFYDAISKVIFESFYGPVADYTFFALLPSYADRDGSSLVHMVNNFISESNDGMSGFYLYNFEELMIGLQKAMADKKKCMLLGVTFALLDLAESHSGSLKGIEIMETGGMKGRRKEMIREEVHHLLSRAFEVPYISSEYGMTELLSQAYAVQQGIFYSPPWMKVVLRNINDPFEKGNHIRRGGINIIDMANIDSCAFIETKDVGSRFEDGGFSVLGRFDSAEIRGCNLMVV